MRRQRLQRQLREGAQHGDRGDASRGDIALDVRLQRIERPVQLRGDAHRAVLQLAVEVAAQVHREGVRSAERAGHFRRAVVRPGFQRSE